MSEIMTALQAFKAMKLFLEKYYENTSSEDIASLLGDLQFLENNEPIDPGAWEDWLKCVHKVLENK